MEPLQQSRWVNKPVKAYIKACMDKGVTRKNAKRMYNADKGECWVNNTYVVALKRPENIDFSIDGFLLPEGFVWLSIRRTDRKPIFDWRDMQQIKNQLVGDECEGVQLFPAESRLVDTSNQYHLVVCTEPGKRPPYGFVMREVDYGEADFLNAVQRPKED